MLASQLIDELTDHIEKFGDSRVVMVHGLGDEAMDVFWDEDERGHVVAVVGRY